MMTHPTDTPAPLAAAPTARPPRHWLTAVPGAGLIFTCGAGEFAPCRLACEGSLRGVCDDTHADSCRRALVEGGRCLAAEWLNDLDPGDVLDLRTGPPRPVSSGPVTVTWRDDDWQWEYDTANDTGEAACATG